MNQTEKTWLIIFSLASLFRSRCAVCQLPCKNGKGWAIHHRRYLKKGDVIWKEYKNLGKSRLQYYTDLAPLVRKEPKRFRLMHSSCHHALSKFAQWSKPNRKRLMRLANELS